MNKSKFSVGQPVVDTISHGVYRVTSAHILNGVWHYDIYNPTGFYSRFITDRREDQLEAFKQRPIHGVTAWLIHRRPRLSILAYLYRYNPARFAWLEEIGEA